MSFKAGANSPKKLYELLMGKKLEYSQDIKDGFIALRFDSCVYLKPEVK